MPSRLEAPAILGVDPGSLATGWALVGGTPERPHVIASDVIRTRARAPFADRLASIQRELNDVLKSHQPALAAVEAPFHGVSARSALQLAHARGVILATLSIAGVETNEYSPAEVKKTVTGSGRATKEQVAFMVERLCGLRSKSHDLTDAVAVALCDQVHRRVPQGSGTSRARDAGDAAKSPRKGSRRTASTSRRTREDSAR